MGFSSLLVGLPSWLGQAQREETRLRFTLPSLTGDVPAISDGLLRAVAEERIGHQHHLKSINDDPRWREAVSPDDRVAAVAAVAAAVLGGRGLRGGDDSRRRDLHDQVPAFRPKFSRS